MPSCSTGAFPSLPEGTQGRKARALINVEEPYHTQPTRGPVSSVGLGTDLN